MKAGFILSLLFLSLAVVNLGIGVSRAQRIKQPLPTSLNRLAEAKLVEIKDEADLVVMSGEFATTNETKAEIERTALMIGAGRAKGLAEIELVKSGDGFSKQELEVALEGLAAAGKF